MPLHDADDVRENFAVKSSLTQGLEAHVSAIFAHDAHNTPLGVAALQPFVHANHVKHDEAVQNYWWAIGGLFGNRKGRWSAAIASTAELLGDKRADAVQVMDREAGDFAMLAWLQQCGHRFVVRANSSRRSVVREGKRIAVADALGAVQQLANVFVRPGARTPNRSAKDQKTHPPRKARMATLTVLVATVRVP